MSTNGKLDNPETHSSGNEDLDKQAQLQTEHDNKIEVFSNQIPYKGITADIYKTPEGILVFNQKILGGTDNFSVEKFLEETRHTFGLIKRDLSQSDKFPNFIVDYNGCRFGSISLKMLQLEVINLFEGMTNTKKELPIVYVVGIENIILKMGVPIGEAALKLAKLVHEIKRVESLDLAIKWARSLNNLKVPEDSNVSSLDL